MCCSAAVTQATLDRHIRRRADSRLSHATHNHLMPGFYVVVSGVVGLVAVIFMRESATQPLEGSPPQVDSVGEAIELSDDAQSRPMSASR